MRTSNAIKKALVDKSINKIHLFPDDEDFAKIEELLEALNIARAGSKRLQSNEINLAGADEVKCMNIIHT